MREEAARLEEILGSPAALKRLLIKEIESDTKVHGDERRTLIQAEKRAVAEIKVVDEPITVVVSLKGWGQGTQGARGGCRHARVQGGRCTLRHLCVSKRRHLAGVRHRGQGFRPGVFGRGQRPAWRARRWHAPSPA